MGFGGLVCGFLLVGVGGVEGEGEFLGEGVFEVEVGLEGLTYVDFGAGGGVGFVGVEAGDVGGEGEEVEGGTFDTEEILADVKEFLSDE